MYHFDIISHLKRNLSLRKRIKIEVLVDKQATDLEGIDIEN